ncbi:MAG TPA: SPOR domain-containing protein [Allosphingosinicella sp.]|nr:SPOR domain-containing protein [Allosphingosinicella sp.]
MSVSMRGVRHSLLLAAGTIIATGAEAQSNRPGVLPAGAVVQSLVPDGGAELRRHLTTLADDPRSLEALIGAGRAALQGGDTQAALTFFSRAGEVAPRDPRVKAGMASVLVRMERGQPALNLFAEAVALGAPAWEIAGDRGLAHDMVGDPRRAQQDYALVLQRREDPEVRRRLALSLAISGERDAALRVIDGQLRRNERAAWRAQAFILALTGDWAGANRTAHGMMTPAAAEAITPFLARLPNLTPSQKAMAAHFGRFPNNGGAAAANVRDTRADPGALALATGTPGLRPRSPSVDPAAGAARRRPGPTQEAAQPRNQRPAQSARTPQTLTSQAARDSGLSPVQAARMGSRAARVPPPGAQTPRAEQRSQVTTTNVPAQSRSTLSPARGSAEPQTTSISSIRQPFQLSAANDLSRAPAPRQGSTPGSSNIVLIPTGTVAPGTQPARQQLASAETASPAPASSSVSQSASRPTGSLSDIAAVVAELPDDEARADRPPASTQPATGRAPAVAGGRATQSSTRAAATPASPAHPSRHWVQIAGGANAAALPRELARLRSQAPELANRNAWVAPVNATHRLLVGPFASAAEARAFVNTLARRSVTSFAWTSSAGQEIARLQSGR